jgi:glycine C-acetyltransferase
MKDLFDKIYRDKGPLGKWAEVAEGYFVFPKLEGPISNRMKFNGKEVITWSVNDYLGLANNPEVRKVDAEAAAAYGSAYPMGARMMSGHTDLHEQLQNELAAFVNKEASYLLNFGYQGMVSTIDALVSKDDVIVYDVDAHACIIDGVRLHMGQRFTYRHNDMESIEKNLKRATKMAEKTGGGILLISEGVFGMRGEQGRLKEIVALKKKYNFRLFVDDAHGFGTLGKTGAGAGEEQGVQDDIDVYFATFAKSLQMQLVVGALKRLDMIRSSTKFKDVLWDNVRALQGGLRKRGFDIGTTQSCVTPVYLKGSVPEAMALVKDLRENYGVFTSIVVYPVIPKGLILLRMIPTATHTMEDIEITLEAFSGIRERLGNGTYKRLSASVAAAFGE